MKKGVIVAMLFFLLVAGIVFSENNNENNNNKVDKIIEEKLKNQDEVSVIVVLKDDYDVLNEFSVSVLNEKDDFEKKKAMITKQQDRVLSKLNYETVSLGKKALEIKSLGINKNKVDFKLKTKFTSVNGFSGEVTKEGLEKLKNDPNVKKIYPNRPIKAFLSDSADIVNATNTWRLIYNGTNITGKGETICIIDTGVDYTHPDLGGCFGSGCKVIGGYDFITPDEDPIDDEGHGTHVAGIVASTNLIYRGIAPDANIVAVKSLNSTGEGTETTIVNGINWCVDNSSIFNITVISMSLGSTSLFSSYCDDSFSLMAAAIDAAIAKNISVIAATGNVGSTTGIGSPACIKNVTSVGGVNKNDAIEYNRNNVTDLLAPGLSIISLANGGGTTTKGGTSMSTPHVAGAFALLHQYFKLTENKVVMPNETQRYLNDTGKQITDSGEGNSGLTFSRINIFAAIGSLDTLSPVITITNPENNSIKTNLSFIVNITSNEVLVNATLEVNNTNFTMAGSGTKWSLNVSSLVNGTYIYKIYGNDTFGNVGTSERTINIVNDAIPEVRSVNISSTDYLNRTNGTLTSYWDFFDPNNDNPEGNETIWYNNSEKVAELINYTTITSNYTKKNQNWIFSVRVFDGINWSDWVNSTNLTIRNSNPILSSIPNIIVNETDLVNLNATGSVNATDNDGDELTFTYSSPLNSTGQWLTTTTDARNYTVIVNVSDNDNGYDSQNVIITVLDKVSGVNDTVTGNFSDIETNVQNLQLKINNTLFNSSSVILNLQQVNFSDSEHTIAVFNFNFSNTTKFDFLNIKINKTFVDGRESIVMRGINLTSQGRTKTIYMNRTNTTLNSVCVKDTELSSINEMTSNCGASDETELACDGVSTNGFICTLEGTFYKITGLSHSGIKQISYTRPSDPAPSPSSSSGGSSGGGGGGGGAFFTCNMDWDCTSWSACDGKWQIRECNFVKVAQHTQSTQCPLIKDVPKMAKKCEVREIESKTTEAVNVTEKPESKAMASITGAATAEVEKISNFFVGVVIIISIIVVGILIYTLIFAHRKK